MAIAQDNTLGNLGSILQSIPGLSQAVNGETTTSNTSISPQGLSYLLQSILGSTNGLASVAGGQNTAGLYNSTVQTQMVNDLLTRSAGEVASKNATTTTTKAPTLSLGDTLMQGAAGLIGTKLLSKGVNSLGSTVADALGLGDTTTAGGAAAAQSLLGATTGSSGAFTGAGVTAGVNGAVADATAQGAALSGAASSGAAATGGAASGTAAGLEGAGIGDAIGGTGAGAIGAGLGSALGLTGTAVGAATAGGLAAGGATLGGLGGAVAGDVAASTAGIAAAEGVGDAAAGAAASGGFADALAAIGTALAWVVCTELESTGEMSHENYTKATPHFLTRMRLKPSAVRGYHYWAVPYTRVMRRKDRLGRFARACMRPIANGRATMIASGRPNFWGCVTFWVIEPICSLLGNTIARKPQNWQSLYSFKTGEK